MRVLLLWSCLLLPGSRALKGPKEISGFEGDTISVRCSYEKELKERQKYWCRKKRWLLFPCSDTIYSGEDGQEVVSGRVSIRDNRQELAFTVTLRDLTREDEGEYWCGIRILGFDKTFLVSLIIFPGPCCPPSPLSSLQPLATSFQPKAKVWQTQAMELTSPDLQLRVTTAKQGKTGAKAPPYTDTSLHAHAGPSLYTSASPHEETSSYSATTPHTATSPSAGSSRLATQLDFTSAKGTSPNPSSSSSKSRVSIPMIRILAPVLVLLALLLATGLAVLGSFVLRRRRKDPPKPLGLHTGFMEQSCLKVLTDAHEAMEPEKNQQVHLSQLAKKEEPGCIPEYAVVKLADPCASHKPSELPNTELQCLNQTSEEEESSSQDPKGDSIPEPLHYLSEEKLYLSEFIPV
ncbi:PREDICTED: CMRF35-like molecule 9 [Chrysochloris asiatica]|uniref:CMRF35-like molecule 9 n=1 Tax=Chrysochloris asiatica TaxID=185453 RepID=A0A9B0SZ47_CHRAS|nr:PREDICTED: CMRF35-like molecule 9 [Chrysochloris asiatica]